MGWVVSRVLSISRQSVTFFLSACPRTSLKLATQLAAPTSAGMSSAMPVKQITCFVSELGAGVDGVAGGLEDLGAVLGVVEPLDEGRVGAHVDGADGALQPGVLEHREVLGLDQLDARAAEPLGDLDELGDVPVRREAPLHDRLPDPAVLDPLAGSRLRGLRPRLRRTAQADAPRATAAVSISRRREGWLGDSGDGGLVGKSLTGRSPWFVRLSGFAGAAPSQS